MKNLLRPLDAVRRWIRWRRRFRKLRDDDPFIYD